MNKLKIHFFLILSFTSIISFSQHGESTIFFEDGSTKKWNIKNISNYRYNNKFTKPMVRIELNDEKSNKLIVYEFIQLKKKQKKIFVKVDFEGEKTTLYSKKTTMLSSTNQNNSIGNSNLNRTDGNIFYAKKNNELYSIELSSEIGGAMSIYGSGFKKRALVFFSDCPQLVEKIKTKEIKKKDKLKAFEYYEKNCN